MVIYQVKNKINGKIYIGKTRQPLIKRKKQHMYSASRNDHKSHFHSAIIKYGTKSFEWKIILYCENENGNDYEKKVIKLFGAFNREIGYNKTIGGDGVIGYIPTAEHKRKTSESMKGKFVGRKMSESQKRYLSKINTGKKTSQKTKDILSKIHSHRNINKIKYRMMKDATIVCLKNLGFSNNEIARFYGVSRQTIRTRIKYIKKYGILL